MLHPSKKNSRDFHKRLCRVGNDGQDIIIAADVPGTLPCLLFWFPSISSAVTMGLNEICPPLSILDQLLWLCSSWNLVVVCHSSPCIQFILSLPLFLVSWTLVCITMYGILSGFILDFCPNHHSCLSWIFCKRVISSPSCILITLLLFSIVLKLSVFPLGCSFLQSKSFVHRLFLIFQHSRVLGSWSTSQISYNSNPSTASSGSINLGHLYKPLLNIATTTCIFCKLQWKCNTQVTVTNPAKLSL